jgi:hypothetical protein
MVLLENMVVLFLDFEQLSILVVLIYISTKVFKGSCSPTSSPTFVVACVLDDSHWNGREVQS